MKRQQRRKYKATIDVGLWVPPYLQGTAIYLERKPRFKRCVDEEIRRYLDLTELGKRRWFHHKTLGDYDDDVSYFEVHKHLEQRVLDAAWESSMKMTAAPHPEAAECTPPDNPDKPWIKRQVFRLQWELEDDGWLLDWRCADAVVAFEESRQQRVYGDWLRRKLCSIPICATVHLS